jgi:L-alanine-DL-glutamate epimerase-like enolase superfamily enzyme
MKIKDIAAILVEERTVLVKVSTDEGIVGIGECSPMRPRKLVAETVFQFIRPLLIGMDPFDIERIWETFFVGTYKLRGRLSTIAFSGVEVALWDIMGKALNLPVHRLLGGLYREKVRMYASFMRRDQSPLEVARRAAEAVQQGFTAVKIKIGKRWGFDSLPDNAVETVREVRAAVGDDIELMVDCNSAYSAVRAIQIGRQLEQYGIFHYEEPVQEHDIESLAKVSRALDVPVAAGEQHHTKYEFKDMLVREAVDIVQADIIKAGGFWECKKIAAMADAFSKIHTPHNTQPTIGIIATVHFAASTPNCRYAQEYNMEPHPLRETLLKESIRVKDGYIDVPTGPGLGIELNEDVVKKQGVQIQ